MLGGAAEKYNEIQEEKRAVAANILAAQKKYLLEAGLTKMANTKQMEKEAKARISKGVSIGFDRKAALALEMSGELESIIKRVEKLKDDPDRKPSEANIKKMSQAILENVPEDKLALAIENALDAGAAKELTAEKLINAIFSATTPSEVAEAASMVGDFSGGKGLPSIDRLGVNLLALTEFEPSKEAQAKKLLEGNLAHLLGSKTSSTNAMGATIYDYPDPTAAGNILNKAFDYYKEQRSDPFLQKDLIDITSEITQKVNSLIQNDVDLNTIANQYDFNMDPSQFEFTKKDQTIKPPSLMSDEEKLFNESQEKFTYDNNDILKQNYLE